MAEPAIESQLKCGNGKRSIGIYGDTINIAARMEEAARAHGVRCVISSAVTTALVGCKSLRPLGEGQVKGIAAPVSICAYEIGSAIGS